MKDDTRSIIKLILAALIVLVIGLLSDYYVDNLEIENCIITSRTLLKAIIITITIVLLILAFYIIPYAINKRIKYKFYSCQQIEIAKKILNKNIQSANDFFLKIKSYDYDKQIKPYNTLNKNPNYFVKTDFDKAVSLAKEFKELILDISKYRYIELKEDKTIDIFTYLRKDKNIKIRDGIIIFHDLSNILHGELLKQKRFIILNPKKLKKLIRKKRIPEKI